MRRPPLAAALGAALLTTGVLPANAPGAGGPRPAGEGSVGTADRLAKVTTCQQVSKEITGEASYATAQDLGIDPDPATGGVDSGVTCILFKNSRVSPIGSHSAAHALGERPAQEFIEAD
ncbi:hypothetical protein [Streptomyces sp. NPDC001292]|uniref:hypothetical protein n=1 Tax=Streptomyces sp. NPDC001292 TaxID=3364558 RepID=UPI003682D50B